MAYQKRNSSDVYDRLAYRLHAMTTIDPDFDMGNGITVDQLEQLTDDLREALNSYNATLMEADDQRSRIIELEKQAQDAAERLLSAALVQYGRDSREYRRIGGTRKSEILPTGTRPLTFEPQPANGSAGRQNNGKAAQKKDS